MLYKLAHIIQANLPFLWNFVEECNALVFVSQKSKALRSLGDCCDYGIRLATEADADALASFFREQPEDSYRWFKPHAFDVATMRRLLRLRSYVIYIQEENGQVIGYAFLRCFCNNKCFIGKMVDYRHQGKGVCTALCRVGMRMATLLGIRMYESINKDNVGSMKASEKACEVMVVETLEDGDMLIEDKPKRDDKWYERHGRL